MSLNYSPSPYTDWHLPYSHRRNHALTQPRTASVVRRVPLHTTRLPHRAAPICHATRRVALASGAGNLVSVTSVAAAPLVGGIGFVGCVGGVARRALAICLLLHQLLLFA